MARDVQAPTSIVHTDANGKSVAQVGTTPPVSGSDVGIQVYANLGSAVIPVSPSNVGVSLNSFNQVSVANTATQIIAANSSRAALLVQNNGTATIFLGSSNSVTTSNGFALQAGCTVGLPQVAALWGIVASTSQTATYLEFQ